MVLSLPCKAGCPCQVTDLSLLSPGTDTQCQYDTVSDFLNLIQDQDFEPGECQSAISGSLLKGQIWW